METKIPLAPLKLRLPVLYTNFHDTFIAMTLRVTVRKAGHIPSILS